VYPADTVLDVFTYAGAPGNYNLNLGAGAGIWYQKNGWSISANYVSANADGSTPSVTAACAAGTSTACGGIGTAASQETGTVQVGYAASNWGAAVAYNYSNGVGPASGTPLAVLGGSTLANAKGGKAIFDTVNSVGLSAYWQPTTTGWIPSVSAGWGLNGYNESNGAFAFNGATSNSWYVGLQWSDAFIKGNALGMAFGQPTFVTNSGSFGGTPHDAGYAWEWWYKFQVTDNISVTPAIYYLSNPLGQAGFVEAQVNRTAGDAALTNFGGIIKTTFKF